jgi:GTP-binding protein
MLISAEHNEGLADLHEKMLAFPSYQAVEDAEAPLTVAVVGRPNVGKSTLINTLIGDNRLLTAPIAGTTRDAIIVDTKHFRVIDTAGQRRSSQVVDDLESMSIAEARRALHYAHVAVVVIDGSDSLDKQDLAIIAECIAEGRAVVVALNKWDAVPAKDRKTALAHFHERLTKSLHEVKAVPVVTLSALQGKNLPGLIKEIKRVYATWNHRVPTGRLNRWFAKVLADRAPPLSTTGRRIKLKYITQVKARPPQFVIFTSSKTDDLPAAYLRYLHNSLTQTFKLSSVPVRLTLKKSHNPYNRA